MTRLRIEEKALSATIRHLGRRPWFRAVLIATGAIAAVATSAVWLNAQRGGPAIQWSNPPSVEFLTPNETRTVTVVFQSRQRLDNVTVFVTPSLSGVVIPSPTSFNRIEPNQAYQLTLLLKPGSAAGGRSSTARFISK